MPRPSQFIADQFREVDQGLAGVDRSGEIEARSMQSLGKGLQQFGQGLGQYQERKRVLDARLLQDDATNAALEAGQQSLDFSLTSPDAQPDGSDMVETFEEGYNEMKQGYLDSLQDDEQKARADVIFERERLKRAESLFGEQRKRHLEFKINQAEENRIKYNGQVLQNPDLFSEALASVDSMQDAFAASGAISPEAAAAVKQKSRKDLVYSAIDGMTLVGQDYDEAIGDIVEGRFSLLLNQKEKASLINMIQTRKVQANNSELQQLARERAEDTERKAEIQEDTFTDLFTQASESTSSEERDEIQKRIDFAIGSQRIKREDAEYIRSFMAKPRVLNIDDDRRSFDISGMIVDGTSLPQVNRVIKRDVMNGVINPATGEKLLRQVAAMKESIGQSGSKLHNSKVRIAKDVLDARYGSKSLLEKLDMTGQATQERQLTRAQADSMLLNRMLENPGLDPREAAVLVIQELGGLDDKSVPMVPGVSPAMQDNPDNIMEEIKKVERDFRSGKLSAPKRNKQLQLLNQRRKSLISIEDARAQLDAVNQKIMSLRKQNNQGLTE